MEKYNVAVVGATGVVGRKMVQVLEERKIPIDNLYLFSSARSAGTKLTYNGNEYTVEELDEHSFDRDIDFAIFSAGASTSKVYAPIAAEHNVVVIDNSSCWRMDPTVPLVVPEVNGGDALENHGIIANPNCSTIQAVVALKPIYDNWGIKRIVYSTYQSVSGSGRDGIEDLKNGVNGEPNKFYPVPIAYNVIPHIDVFTDNGYTKEELKMVNETHKIFHDDSIRVTATTARVPVIYCHSEAINIETLKPFEMEDVFKAFEEDKDVIVKDSITEPGYPTAKECEDTDDVYVGRIRRDFSVDNGLNIWVVADNIRKGAATNAVQIAQYLIEKDYFNKRK